MFNVEAARNAVQTLHNERLSLEPALDPERWTMPESRNRYLRVMVPEGSFTLSYEAKVTLAPTSRRPSRSPRSRPATCRFPC